MGRFSADDQFSAKPIYWLGKQLTAFGVWLMGYRWGTDLYAAGMDAGREETEQAFIVGVHHLCPESDPYPIIPDEQIREAQAKINERFGIGTGRLTPVAEPKED